MRRIYYATRNMSRGYFIEFITRMPAVSARANPKKKGLSEGPKALLSSWWAMRDSNARPLVPETNALST